MIIKIKIYVYCLSFEKNYLEPYLTKIDFLAKKYFTDSTFLYPFPIPFPDRCLDRGDDPETGAGFGRKGMGGLENGYGF